MKKFAVLISNSGSGSNLQAIIDAIEIKKLNASIAVVISDKDDAYGLKRAKKHNIPSYIFDGKNEKLELLLKEKFPIDFVILTGWKKIIPDSFIHMFPNKILNIHPGLIPDTLNGSVFNPDNTVALWNRGMYMNKAIQNFLDNKATFAGSTVHFLSLEFDFGRVLKRDFEKIKKDDTVESLYERLKKKEHKMLVNSLVQLCADTNI